MIPKPLEQRYKPKPSVKKKVDIGLAEARKYYNEIYRIRLRWMKEEGYA